MGEVAVDMLVGAEEATNTRVPDRTIRHQRLTATLNSLLSRHHSHTGPSTRASILLPNTNNLHQWAIHSTSSSGLIMASPNTRASLHCLRKIIIPTMPNTSTRSNNLPMLSNHSRPLPTAPPLSSLMASPTRRNSSQVVLRSSGGHRRPRILLNTSHLPSSSELEEVVEDTTTSPRHSQWVRPLGWALTMVHLAIPLLQ